MIGEVVAGAVQVTMMSVPELAVVGAAGYDGGCIIVIVAP